jgi:hypothetical protein
MTIDQRETGNLIGSDKVEGTAALSRQTIAMAADGFAVPSGADFSGARRSQVISRAAQ